MFVFYPGLKAGVMQKVLCKNNFPTSVLILPLILILFFAGFPCGVLSFFVVFRAGGFCVCFLPQLESWGYAKILSLMFIPDAKHGVRTAIFRNENRNTK